MPGTENGFDLSASEQRLLDIYGELTELLADHADELPPFARRNSIKAVAALWQVANGLGAQPGQVYDIGA